jgi:hypothetical protein
MPKASKNRLIGAALILLAAGVLGAMQWLPGPTPPNVDPFWATPEHKKNMEAGRQIKGMVIDAQRNPISGAVVTLTVVGSGKLQGSTVSADDGTYSINGVPPFQDYKLQAKFKNNASPLHEVSQYNTAPSLFFVLELPQKGAKKPAPPKS